MMNKIISTFLKILLVLEIRIRGPRIKNSAWRTKLLRCAPGAHTFLFQQKLFIDEHRKIIYLNNPKVACTSLKSTLLESDAMRKNFLKISNQKPPLRKGFMSFINSVPNHSIRRIRFIGRIHFIDGSFFFAGRDEEKHFKQRKITPENLNAYFIFTFVRNPFTKLVSFFRHKYNYQHGRYFINRSRFFWIDVIGSFDELAHKISKLPDCYLEKHIESQHLDMNRMRSLGIDIDFIGKFETLKQDFEPIRQKFNLLRLGHENKSEGEHEDWRDYYTPKTAKMVYQRYSKDFEMFGYEDEYPKLLDYLAAKQKKA